MLRHVIQFDETTDTGTMTGPTLIVIAEESGPILPARMARVRRCAGPAWPDSTSVERKAELPAVLPLEPFTLKPKSTLP